MHAFELYPYIFYPQTRRSIQLLPGGEFAGRRRPKHSDRIPYDADGTGEFSRDYCGVSGIGGAKYIHCVEEACPDGGGNDAGGDGVVIEWARRPAMGSSSVGCGFDVQEVLVKCRIGRFPSTKSFYLLVSVLSGFLLFVTFFWLVA